MNWIRTHQAQSVGAVFIFFGALLLICPQVVMPKKKLDQLKKIHFPSAAATKSKDEKMPLALNIFLRFFGLILLICGAVCWYAGTL